MVEFNRVSPRRFHPAPEDRSLSQAGPFNPEQPIESAGIIGAKAVFYNQGVAELYEAAVRRGEGQVAAEGPLQVTTAPHTGRSAWWAWRLA